jgi:hypothetical protein
MTTPSQTDLFGDTDPPRKAGPGYLSWLNDLELPDGLKFWALSTEKLAPGVPHEYVDVIICIHPDDPKKRWVQLVIDLRTGRKYVGEEAGPA